LAHFPDRIQRILQLDDDAYGGKQECPGAEQRSQNARSGPAGIDQHRLDGIGAGFAQQVFDGHRDLPGNRIAAKYEARNRDRYDDQRTN